MKFLEHERAVLESLYPEREQWWEYLYLLSDRVQEDEGEVPANGVRFLCLIRQRPTKFIYTNNSHWWSNDEEDEELDHTGVGNHLPKEFREIGYPEDADYPTVTDALEAFIAKWSSLDQPTRDRLWEEFAPAEVTQ